MHLFKQNWMENKFRFLLAHFQVSHPLFRDIKQLFSGISRTSALAPSSVVQAFCHIWGKICNETSQSHREATTFLIKKFKICKIQVNSMFQM